MTHGSVRLSVVCSFVLIAATGVLHGCGDSTGRVSASDSSSGGVGLKCGRTRAEADEWIARYPDDASVSAYIGRFGWNVLRLGGAIPDDELLEAVDESYDAIVAALPRRERPGA